VGQLGHMGTRIWSRRGQQSACGEACKAWRPCSKAPNTHRLHGSRCDAHYAAVPINLSVVERPPGPPPSDKDGGGKGSLTLSAPLLPQAAASGAATSERGAHDPCCASGAATTRCD